MRWPGAVSRGWRVAGWTAAVGALVVVGCVSFEPDTVFACQPDGSCPEGHVCVDGLCLPGDSSPGDGGVTGRDAGGAGGGDAGGGGGDAGAGGGGTGGRGGGVDGGSLPACVEGASPGEDGVYVDLDSVGPGIGTAESPYKRLDQALDAVWPVVYVRGSGAKLPTLSLGAYGLRIEGGWSGNGGLWVKSCGESARPRLAFSQSVGVRVVAGGAVVLEDIAIEQGAQLSGGPDVGGSFGVWVEDGADLTLERVSVSSGPGLSPPRPAVPSAAGNSCDDTSNCERGLPGGDGGAGDASPAGVFGATGFKPGSGTQGLNGEDGENGVASRATVARCADACSGSCETGCGVSVAPDAGIPLDAGTCGCGGLGGLGGAGGPGGHASVGLMVVGHGARVALWGSDVRCGGGGNGAAGGEGGEGGTGSVGHRGPPIVCVQPGSSCGMKGSSTDCGCVLSAAGSASAPEGGAGGPGGVGGPGGAGAGGPCFAVVTVERPTITADGATRLQHGSGGSGAGDAAAGVSGPRLDLD